LTIKLHFATNIVAFFVSPSKLLPVYQATFSRKLANFAIGTTQGHQDTK
jgi:hypothetical protein